MKIEVDTLNDSVDEIKKTITLLQDALERRTGITPSGLKIPLRPSEFAKDEPKIIFKNIDEKKSTQTASTTSTNTFTNVTLPVPKEKLDIKKRKVLKQDEHAQKEEEEDEDRFLPKIQYKDYW